MVTPATLIDAYLWQMASEAHFTKRLLCSIHRFVPEPLRFEQRLQQACA